MRKFVSATSLACVLVACAFFISCSSSSSTQVTHFAVPTSVLLSPAPNVSLELGKFVTFLAAAHDAQGGSLTETFTFQSSNPSVITVANNGIACAGTWDSLAAPVVCTPGSTGTAQVTAVANGVVSAPTTVYVHQHITRVVVQPVPGQPPTLSSSCLSRDANHSGPEHLLYEAIAYGTPPVGSNTPPDLTSTVGQFTWAFTAPGAQSTVSTAVTLSSAGAIAPLNQELATAGMPGVALIYATVNGVSSQPLQFTTCPVQSISLDVQGFPSSTTSILMTTGSSATINATVIDSVGMSITGVPLTWTSSYPHAVTVTAGGSNVFGSVGTVSGTIAGRAAITASCGPPSCNGGITPSMPIYPASALAVQMTSSSSAAPPTPTIYVTSTGCSGTTLSCATILIPFTQSSTTAVLSPGAAVVLPATPNSFVTGKTSGIAYLGVDSTAAGFTNQGAMVFTGASTSQAAGAFGRVLAVSPDAQTVIFSDTLDSPSRVNICTNCGGARTVTPIFLSNAAATTPAVATAAAFSPDGLKAYIASNGSCPATAPPSTGCLVVYSQADAPQFIPLSAVPTDAAFIGEGGVGYVAQTSQTSFLPTCGPILGQAPSLGNANLAAQYLRPLPDGMSLLALTPPDVQTLTATISGSPVPGDLGCFSPRNPPLNTSPYSITNNVTSPINLGTGPFTPKQFFLSRDGSVAYILAQTTSGSPFPFIITFNLQAGTSSQISLAGGAIPLSAGISPGGDELLVGADDSQLHVIETATGLDTQQLQLNFANNTSLCIGPGNPATQVEVASLTISAAQQSAPPLTNTTFTYSLQNGTTPQVGQSLVLTGMSDTNNNGTFTITAVNPTSSNAGTITVVNPAGVTATGQSGTGTVPLTCNPDLVVVAP
jgi:hypothetical protein